MKNKDIGKFEDHDVKIFTTNYEDEVVNQLLSLLSVPVFKDAKIRLMPDCHAGAGCCIGFTSNLGEYVIPNIVGVDIGCSISVVKLKDRTIDFSKLDEVIKSRIPVGKEVHDNTNYLDKHYHSQYFKGKELITSCICYRELKDPKRLYRALGSLGGGEDLIASVRVNSS